VVFFGLLIPLSIEASLVGMSFRVMFGLGTSVPILGFAVLMGLSTTIAQTYLDSIVKYEPYARKVFGAAFAVYGLYLLYLFLAKFMWAG
jgi:cytochrome c biogenesis protein CcdA